MVGCFDMISCATSSLVHDNFKWFDVTFCDLRKFGLVNGHTSPYVTHNSATIKWLSSTNTQKSFREKTSSVGYILCILYQYFCTHEMFATLADGLVWNVNTVHMHHCSYGGQCMDLLAFVRMYTRV